MTNRQKEREIGDPPELKCREHYSSSPKGCEEQEPLKLLLDIEKKVTETLIPSSNDSAEDNFTKFKNLISAVKRWWSYPEADADQMDSGNNPVFCLPVFSDDYQPDDEVEIAVGDFFTAYHELKKSCKAGSFDQYIRTKDTRDLLVKAACGLFYKLEKDSSINSDRIIQRASIILRFMFPRYYGIYSRSLLIGIPYLARSDVKLTNDAQTLGNNDEGIIDSLAGQLQSAMLLLFWLTNIFLSREDKKKYGLSGFDMAYWQLSRCCLGNNWESTWRGQNETESPKDCATISELREKGLMCEDFWSDYNAVRDPEVEKEDNKIIRSRIEARLLESFTDWIFKEYWQEIIKHIVKDARIKEEDEIIGSSLEMIEVKKKLVQYAGSSNVLVVGPTGSGKEAIAKHLHALSQKKGELISVNVAALPAALADALLFGIKKGAATGVEESPGLIKTALGGSLFLDEIHTAPAALQGKLLRFLETGEIDPVGASGETTEIKSINNNKTKNIEKVALKGEATINVIAATNKIENVIDDLKYRLARRIIVLSPLSARIEEDIKDLCKRFCGESSKISPCGISYLQKIADNLGGNIRELKNIIQEASDRYPTRILTKFELSHIASSRLAVFGNAASNGNHHAAKTIGLERLLFDFIDLPSIIKYIESEVGDQESKRKSLENCKKMNVETFLKEFLGFYVQEGLKNNKVNYRLALGKINELLGTEFTLKSNTSTKKESQVRGAILGEEESISFTEKIDIGDAS